MILLFPPSPSTFSHCVCLFKVFWCSLMPGRREHGEEIGPEVLKQSKERDTESMFGSG